MFNTPILLIIFNRPETTEKVFESIRTIKPKELYIAADGPRVEKEGEYEKCMQARSIVGKIDWDCNVKTLLRDNNLGCGVGPADAISWFFSQVEQGIILEDDCLPNRSFFYFCEQLLDFYKDDQQIMHIGGHNSLGIVNYKFSYLFTKYCISWGWATWRRAWQLYDFELKDLEDFKERKIIQNVINNKNEQAYWLNTFEMVSNGKRKDIWDYQWIYTLWRNSGLAIISSVNLVSNIGFGKDATHTFEDFSKLENLPTQEIKEIIHPSIRKVNNSFDKRLYKKSINPPTTYINRLRNIYYMLKRFGN